VVIFGINKNNPLVHKLKFSLGGNPLTIVRSYKYLGADFGQRGEWKSFKEKILQKAKKKYGLVLILHARHSFLSTLALTNIWQALVRPIMEYAAEIWPSRGENFRKKEGNLGPI